MDENEFRALLAVEGKKVTITKSMHEIPYTAAVISAENDIVTYDYGKTKEKAIQKLIHRYYADN